MVKSDLGKEVAEFLDKNVFMVVATADEQSQPEAALMMYLMDENLDFYFVTRRQTRKFKNLKKNPEVAFVIGLGSESSTMQGKGRVELLEEKDVEFMKELEKHPNLVSAYLGPFLELVGLDFAVFRIKPDWLRLLSWDPTKRVESYHQILPAGLKA
ncbi:MAG: pyridoxamine 5'-phosphate oxidase family protein [bacterium]|nr:pyridoxamine 5'-phosphate oxidase family protein [bacterium]